MKKLLLLTLVLISSVFVYAQEETVIEIQSKRGPYLTNRFFDNIFISVGGGVNVYVGENDWCGTLGKRLAPALDISLGKWITPSVGVRLQYAGLKAKGWNYGVGPYTQDLDKDNEHGSNIYNEKFNIMNLHADLMWNVSNAIGGYKETRFWDFVPYVGFGWGRSAANDNHDNELVANVGLLNVLRISNAFDINIEGRLMIASDRLDGVARRGTKFEGMGTLTAGIAYNFPVRGFKRASDIIVIDDNTEFINKINDLEGMLQKAESARDALKKQLADEQAKAPKVVSEPYPVVPEFAIFFTIGKANITQKELINIEAVANAIKELPDVKFILFASADKETGTPEYNQLLSEKRGKAVYDALTQKYGVNPDQLEINAVGSSDQIYEGAAYNRVVVIRSEK